LGLISEFADWYWVFRFRAHVTETKFRSSVSDYTGMYRPEGAPGMDLWLNVPQKETPNADFERINHDSSASAFTNKTTAL
jgi:hypothetical protein